MISWTRAWAAVVVVAAMAGCGGGIDKSKAHVRFVNATSDYAALDLEIADETVYRSVAYGADTRYADVDADDVDADVSSPGSATVLSSAAVSLSEDDHYTIVAYGRAGSLRQVLLNDNTDGPASGKALVRVLNAAPDAGALDVYLTAESDTLTQSTALQASAAYGTLNSFVTINSGTWRLRIAAAGSKTDVRLDVSGLSFGSGSVRTIVVTPSRGGVLVNALVLAQRDDVANAANTKARVRVVAGVGGSAAVSASVGGSTLLSAETAPALTGYTTLNAGTVAVAASADGVAAALTSATLAGGGDYTLLVHGAAGAPTAVLIEDDNQRPSSSAQARLRVVNGAQGATGALALKLDFLVTISGVAVGTASDYADVNAATTPQLDVSAAGSTGTLCSVANKDIAANGVYTMFALGDASGATCVLSTDR